VQQDVECQAPDENGGDHGHADERLRKVLQPGELIVEFGELFFCGLLLMPHDRESRVEFAFAKAHIFGEIIEGFGQRLEFYANRVNLSRQPRKPAIGVFRIAEIVHELERSGEATKDGRDQGPIKRHRDTR